MLKKWNIIRYHKTSLNFWPILRSLSHNFYNEYQKNYDVIMSKQQVTMNYIEEIIITNDTKKIRQYQTSRIFLSLQPILWARPHNSYKWVWTKLWCIMSKQQQSRINYIEEISIKSNAKKIKYYQISKNYC